MKRVLLTAVLTVSASAYQLEGVSVEAGYGTESPITDVTSPSDIITVEEVEEKHPFDFREIIFNRDGFAFSSNGGFGQVTSIYLWGTDPKRTVMYIDGIRVNDFTTPNQSPSYEHLLLDDIYQIEIIKGVQSGIWGPDAVGGVINVVTAKPEKGLHIKLKGLAGDYNTKKAGLTLSYADEKIDILLGYHWLKTSGFSAVEPIKSSPLYGKRWDEIGWERDPYRNDTFNFKMGWNITPDDRFETVVKTIDAVVHYDSIDFLSGEPIDAPDGPYTINHLTQRFYKVEYKKKLKRNEIRVFMTKSEFIRTQYGGYEGEYREYTVKDRINYSFGFVNLGFTRSDYKQIKSGGSPLNGFYHGNGYYATNVIKLKKVVLLQTIRHDSYSAFKDKTTWKLGGKYFLAESLYLSGNWGTGYNIPSLDQLYNPWWGNSGLKPENSIQWDVGAGYKGFKVSYFRYSIKDLIDYDFTLYRYVNIPGKTKIHGIDGSYSSYISRINTFLRLNYTYLYALKNDGSRLPRRPIHQIGFDVVWYPSQLVNMGLSGVYVDKRKDTTGAQTGYYTVVNYYANFTVNENMKGFFKIENLTDKYYQTVDGYATAGRSLYAGIELKW
ncbi:TonB-dependent receptor plug domain-containing protein [Persephonella sp.]